MSIYTVRDNVKNTIAGKELLLQNWNNRTDAEWEESGTHKLSMCKMLEINIDELKRILNDLEHCCIQASYDSWALNPERMGR